jgi:uncharacterized membrane protein YdcZ (DUF606 family)
MDIITTIISFVVGILTPILMQVAKNNGWELDGWKYQLVALAVSVGVALGAIVIAGKFDVSNAVGTLTLTMTTIELVYTQIIKPHSTNTEI